MQSKQELNNKVDIKEDRVENQKIKVQILSIDNDMAICKHVMSSYSAKAYIRKGMKLEIGQIVILEYRRSSIGGGYIIADELVDKIDARVLYVQHIFEDNVVMVSMILEDLSTHNRIHSIVSSANKMFCDANTVVVGDIVTVKKNNGSVFGIELQVQ